MSQTPIIEEPQTDFGYSYERAVDVLDEDGSTWLPCRFILSFQPQVSNVQKDAQTYDDKGAQNEIKTSESWNADLSIQSHHDDTGAYLPEVQRLYTATLPDATGRDAIRTIRWYDLPDGREPNLDDAFMGQATVAVAPGQTGAAGEINSLNFTLTGKGRRVKIAHPDASEI